MENWLHLEAKRSMVRHTHSTGKLPEAVGGSERHLEVGTTDEREREKQEVSSMFFMSSYCYYHRNLLAPLHRH